MSNNFDQKISRRSLLKGAAALAGVALVPAVLTSKEAAASTKASKGAMRYQDKPMGNKDCSKCLQFVPGKTAKATGICKVVAGAISPHGYCIAWAPKS